MLHIDYSVQILLEYSFVKHVSLSGAGVALFLIFSDFCGFRDEY